MNDPGRDQTQQLALLGDEPLSSTDGHAHTCTGHKPGINISGSTHFHLTLTSLRLLLLLLCLRVSPPAC